MSASTMRRSFATRPRALTMDRLGWSALRLPARGPPKRRSSASSGRLLTTSHTRFIFVNEGERRVAWTKGSLDPSKGAIVFVETEATSFPTSPDPIRPGFWRQADPHQAQTAHILRYTPAHVTGSRYCIHAVWVSKRAVLAFPRCRM
jgi:hypothetical protein